MKKIIIVSILTFSSFIAHGQLKIELQAGGSNFIGMSINTAFDIILFESGYHKITPTIGLGTLISGREDPTSIIHCGLNYRYKRWGIGSEVSGFSEKPFLGTSTVNSFVDMIVYPNANFTYTTAFNLYCKISAGAYFAFDRISRPDSNKSYLDFAGDVIPGAGISVGYIF